MSRALTAEEETKLAERRAEFQEFFAECMPVLADFAKALGLPTPPLIVAEPDKYLRAIDEFMSRQTIDGKDWVWIHTRIGYFIGEVLVRRLAGCWFLDEDADSPHFLRYVVGQFQSIEAPIHVDPFEVAQRFLKEPAGRSLVRKLEGITEKLKIGEVP